MKSARMMSLLSVALVMGLGQVATAQQLSQRDKLRTAVQEICPDPEKYLRMIDQYYNAALQARRVRR